MSNPFKRFPFPALSPDEAGTSEAQSRARRYDIQANLLLSCGYTGQAEWFAHLASDTRDKATEDRA